MSTGAREGNVTLGRGSIAPSSLTDVHVRNFGPTAPPLARRTGKVAEQTAMMARLSTAISDGDIEAERAVSIDLAKHLEARGLGLGSAAELYARAAAIRPDTDVLRRLAALEEKLGRHARAADALERALTLDPQVGGRVRLGWLRLRAGDLAASERAFARAAEDSKEPLATELRGALGFIRADALAATDAARCYVDAAARRGGADLGDAELDDLARAHALAPSSSVVASFVAAFERRGKPLVADALVESSVGKYDATSPDASTVRALVKSRSRGDSPGALSLVLSLAARAKGEPDAALSGSELGDLLVRAGLVDVLAEHLGLLAAAATDTPERRRWLTEALALAAGSLADPRAAALLVSELVASDPDDAETLARLEASILDGAVGADARSVLVHRLATPDARLSALAKLVAKLGEVREEPALVALGLRTAVAHADDPTVRTRLANAEKRCEERLAAGRTEASLAARRARAHVLATLPEHRDEWNALLASTPPTDELAGEVFALAAHRALEEQDFDSARRYAAARIALARVGVERASARRLSARVELACGARASALAVLVAEDDSATFGTLAPLALLLAVTEGRLDAVARSASEVARTARPGVRSALERVAVRAWLGHGDIARARSAALDAFDAAPTDPRNACVVVDAFASGDVEEGTSALAAVERASSLLWPDASRVRRLSELAARAGDRVASLSWGQRLLGLRPGDPEPLRAYMAGLVALAEPSRLADALVWVLSLPYTAELLVDVSVQVLTALTADVDRLSGAARRAFDVLGANDETLRDVLVQSGRRARDYGFAASVLERALSCGEGRGDSGEGYSMLADLYAQALDADGEIRALVSAIRDGAMPSGLDERLSRFDPKTLSGDGEIALLDVLSERAPLRGAAESALAYRRLGAALWDMAQDRAGAVAAWVDAARRAPSRGNATLRRDLVDLAGSEEALECLVALAEHEPESSRAGGLLAEAARVAVSIGDTERTFELATRALRKNPALTDALTCAEAGARPGAEGALSSLYTEVAARALGRFGRRAAHFRGARFLEERGAYDLAVEHATAAFLAVPSEGSALQLLARTGAKAGDPGAVFGAVERLEIKGKSGPQQRAAWLVRAADLGDSEVGSSERVDALLRALVLAPDGGTLSKLATALEKVLRVSPGDREAWLLRFSRAARAVLPKCEGPDGARVAVRLVALAIELSDEPPLAWDALDRALACDGDIDEYKDLVPFVARLVASDGSRPAFERVVAVTAKPYASLGAAAYALLGVFARAFSEPVLARTLLVASAIRDADDPRVVVLADEALVLSPDETARKNFARGVSLVRLVEALVYEASLARKSGDSHSELRRLARAVELDPSCLDERMRARFEELRPPESIDASREARVREKIQTGDYRGALEAALEGGLGPVLEVADAAEAAGHHTITSDALERLSQDDAAADVRVDALRRLGRSYGAYDIERAEGYWRRLLSERPGDDEAEVALEDLLTRAQRYPEILDILAVRAGRLANDPTRKESHRFVRLRRAALFEQRLGSLEDARNELFVLLESEPDCVPAMRYLADLAERTADVEATVAMLERIRSLSTVDVDSRNEAELRIARIRLEAGRLEDARSLVKGVLARGESLEATNLRVDIARRLGEPRELGDALAAIARLGADDAEGRSEVLVEAAQAAARAGDVDVSLRRAQEAARVAPQAASVQLFARGLEYRTRGAGSPDDARLTLDSLSQVRTSLQSADVALRAFLMAEASRAISGGGAGLELLLETRAELGPHPLLALGTAERLAAQGRHEDALVAYEEAIVGPLLGMRRPAEVALTASVSAEKVGDLSLALRYAEAASQEPDLRLAALERVRRLAFAFGDERKQRGALRQLVALQQGELRFEAIKDLAGSLLASSSDEDRVEGRALLESALAEAPRGRAVSDELRAWLARLDEERSRREAPPSVEAKREAEAPPPPTEVMPSQEASHESGGVSTPVRGMLSSTPASPTTEEVSPAKPVAPAPPSTREELSADDIEEVASASAPGVPAVVDAPPPLALAEPTDERVAQDPFPPASRDPFPSSRPTEPGAPTSLASTAASSERSRELDHRAVTLGAGVRVHATPVTSLPSILPHVLDGLKKGTFPDGRADAKVVEARALLASGRTLEAEGLLGEAIAEGSSEAADLLAGMLETQAERRSLFVRARRLAADLAPADTKRLEALRQAALADKNQSYARALEHLVRTLEGDGEVPAPPPLGHQTEQPGLFALLTRSGREGLGEAFGLVWEHASTALVRANNTSTSISGLERIVPGNDSLASRLFEATGRLLVLGNARLFRRNVSGPAASEVLLGTPPAAVLRGALPDDPGELGFLLGCAVGAALPHQALLLGQPLGDARVLFRAMLCAFGPPEATRDLDRATAMLGETLWQTLPSKAQRRLSDLLAAHSVSSFEDVLGRAKLAAMRVGYFVAGDFRCAARAVVADAGLDPRVVNEAGAIKDLVRELSALEDLYRLAIRPELADARFFTPSGTGRPGGARGG